MKLPVALWLNAIAGGPTARRNEVTTPTQWTDELIDKQAAHPKISRMAAAFITCTRPRSMAIEHATAWLRRRARTLEGEEAIEEVTVRELRPRGRDPVWLVHVVTGADESDGWEPLLRGFVTDVRRLGMHPTVVVDERSTEVPSTRREVQRAA